MSKKALLLSAISDDDNDNNDRVSLLLQAMEGSGVDEVAVYDLQKVNDEATDNGMEFSARLLEMMNKEFNRILLVNSNEISENLNHILNGNFKFGNGLLELLKSKEITEINNVIARETQLTKEKSRLILLSLDNGNGVPSQLAKVEHIKNIINESGNVDEDLISKEIMPLCRNNYKFSNNVENNKIKSEKRKTKEEGKKGDCVMS